MADKSFRQILEEKLTLKPAPVPLTADPAPSYPWFEIRLERMHQPINRYPHKPRTETEPPKAELPHETPKVDLTLNTALLNPEEIAALHVLGLKSDLIGHSTLRRAYRARILDLHPDRQPPHLPLAAKELLTREFQVVHEAYLVIEKALKRVAQQIPS